MFLKRNQRIAGAMARAQSAPDLGYTPNPIRRRVTDTELFQTMGIHVQQEGSA